MDSVLDNIYRIDVPRSEQIGWLPETDESISCHVFDGDQKVLFGTGYGVFADTVLEQLEKIDGIDVVVVEHGDADHYGGVAYLNEHYEELTIAMPSEDAPVLKKVYNDVTADIELTHDSVYWGWRALKVPGHTAGNMAFLDESRSLLVVGDTFVNSNSEIAASGDWSGSFAPIDPIYNMRDEDARRNLEKLIDYEFEVALITHGEDILEDARIEFDKLLDDLGL